VAIPVVAVRRLVHANCAASFHNMFAQCKTTGPQSRCARSACRFSRFSSSSPPTPSRALPTRICPRLRRRLRSCSCSLPSTPALFTTAPVSRHSSSSPIARFVFSSAPSRLATPTLRQSRAILTSRPCANFLNSRYVMSLLSFCLVSHHRPRRDCKTAVVGKVHVKERQSWSFQEIIDARSRCAAVSAAHAEQRLAVDKQWRRASTEQQSRLCVELAAAELQLCGRCRRDACNILAARSRWRPWRRTARIGRLAARSRRATRRAVQGRTATCGTSQNTVDDERRTCRRRSSRRRRGQAGRVQVARRRQESRACCV
jgi:hypothetical protein